MIEISVSSEIGKLEGVLLHKPGIEIERMTPGNANQALFSDILNKEIVDKEYASFSGVLSKFTKTFEIENLLTEVLAKENLRTEIIKESCRLEDCDFLEEELDKLNAAELAKVLIEGYHYEEGKHSKIYKEERYILKPLYNLFFTRDTSSSLFDEVIINPMASKVRARESYILKTIFQNYFKTPLVSPGNFIPSAKTEGGDILIAREDILCVGNGKRTNKKGIASLIAYFVEKKRNINIIMQELPDFIESFIHLDMVFTFLDKDRCMMYEPLIMKRSGFESYETFHIKVDNGNVTYHRKNNILEALKEFNIKLDPIKCGGNDRWNQDREQWHSGANFFAMDAGKIIGYARNNHTITALDKAGFAVLDAEDVCSGKVQMLDYDKFVVAFKASELPRAGGGARCMTMPLRREKVNW